MEILVTGKLSHLSEEITKSLLPQHKVVFASDDIILSQIDKKVTPFKISPANCDFEKIFNSYSFDAVLFFSQTITGMEDIQNEYHELEACLNLCSKHDVDKFLYLQPKLMQNKTVMQAENSLEVMLSSCKDLCEFYRTKRNMSVVIAYVPVLYGIYENTSIVGSSIYQVQDSAAVQFFVDKNTHLGFLSQEEFSTLLLRILEAWPLKRTGLNIPCAELLSIEDLGGLIKKHYPTVRISYKNMTIPHDSDYTDTYVNEEYDWHPSLLLETSLEKIVSTPHITYDEEKPSLLDRLSEYFSHHSFVLKTVELVLGLIIMEFFNNITLTTAQFQQIDFRLLYIVVMAVMHGIGTGLAAAAISSVSLLAANIQLHTSWSVLAHNIEVWIPYLFYFFAGSAIGYAKDSLKNDNNFLKEEKQVLEDKYILLNEFYMSALKNKNLYKTQIMSYRDSFGRLFDIAKNLDSTIVEEVFDEAIEALENVLDNRSVCIYQCDEAMRFARLVVCSRELMKITEKSLNLLDFEKMTSQFKDGEVWVNVERLPSYPEYAVPIYNNNKPIALILLKKVKWEQMAVYYENLVKIVSGLIKISLVRALEYTSKIEDEMYVEGTRIIKGEFFTEIIKVKEEMKQAGTFEYMLIKLDIPIENHASVAKILSQLIRGSDLIGYNQNNELYLCLNQANENNVQIVLNRIKEKGLDFSIADEKEYV